MINVFSIWEMNKLINQSINKVNEWTSNTSRVKELQLLIHQNNNKNKNVKDKKE
jgi:hypothetical protein